MFICGIIVILLLPNIYCIVPGANNVCSRSVATTTCTRNWLGRRRCSTSYRSEPVCCDGWTSASGAAGCDIPWCIGGWNICPNGGTCTTRDYCACTDNYYSPNCVECTRIANCQDMQYYCTTSTNQQCRRCEYTVNDDEIKAYQVQNQGALPNRICTQLCSWRIDSKQCYPGSCTGSPKTPSTCQCAPGFSSPASDCMTITRLPDITNCLATASTMQEGSVVDYVETVCINTNNPTTYTNHRDVNHISVDWATQFVGPSAVDWPLPYYVADFKVGIILAQVLWYHKRGSSTITSGTIECSTVYSPSNPNLGLNDCSEGQTITASWRHGDVLEIRPQSKNGGFMKVKNYDNGLPGVLETKYYTPVTLTHYTSITFDYEPPVHCLVSSSCSSNMLEVGAPYTRDACTASY